QLKVLNDKEFEELAKDLLELELGIQLQNFKRGRDKGIDLRYSTEVNNNDLVIQVKHYPGSKFADLKRVLLNDEKPKLDKLKPNRYIVFTSLPLNPADTDTLFNGLTPYTLSSNDIYGEDRVLALIRKYPEVEKRFFKLWLSSTTILKKILNHAAEGRSLFFEKKILEKISLYVPTQNFNEALKILNDKKIVIVTGQPGVGKTTISYLLICQLLSRDFKLILVTDSISEAENVLSDDPDERQVIFFDDFLGSNINEVLYPRNTESAIVNFIERIQNSKNKYLIFTTRTTILNQVEFHYEKFRRVKRGQNLEFEVEMKEYDKLDRARILYNHIFHSELGKDQRDAFLLNNVYMDVIEHRNYSPRLIEFITTKRFYNYEGQSYQEHIFKHLNNPNELWQSAFDNQLTDHDRFLLWTIFSLGGYKVIQSNLELAFEKRLEYEIRENGFNRINNAFIDSIKKLIDSFISSYISESSNEFSFINPSVGDFLIEYLRERKQERKRIVLSIKYFDQLIRFFDVKENKGKIVLDEDELKGFYEFFKNECHELMTIEDSHVKAISVIDIYIKYLKASLTEDDLLPWVKSFEGLITRGQFYQLMGVLIHLEEYQLCTIEIVKQFNFLVKSLFQLCHTSDEFEKVLSLFGIYEVSFEEFLNEDDNIEFLADLVSDALNIEFQDNYSEFVDSSSIVDAMRYGSSSDATKLVDESFRDHTHDFIWSSKLTSIENDSLSERLDELINDYAFIDSGSIVSSILESSDYSGEEEIYEDYDREMARMYMERQGRSNLRRHVDRIFKREPTDEDKIRDLFD
ncbi:MAG: restriction endonuclease, partial [Ekhidna sp.]